MTTFPSVTVTDLETKDSFSGQDTKHANLPCMTCMMKGELDRWKESKRATKLVVVADFMRIPMCQAHAEEFTGDRR